MIGERLRAGERLVLDGGTGSELQRRGVDVLQKVTSDLKGWSAMANLGYNPTGPVANRPVFSTRRPSRGPDIIQATDYYPSRVAGFASEWLDLGAQIVGGCCASGPEHIAAIRRVVPYP